MFLDYLPSLPRTARPLVFGIVLGVSLSISSSAVAQYFQRRQRRIALSQSETSEFESRPIELRSDEVLDGVVGLIGARIGISSFVCVPYPLPRKHTTYPRAFTLQGTERRDSRKGGGRPSFWPLYSMLNVLFSF